MSAAGENKFQTDDALSAKTRYRDLVVRIWPYIAKYKGFLILLGLIGTPTSRFPLSLEFPTTTY